MRDGMGPKLLVYHFSPHVEFVLKWYMLRLFFSHCSRWCFVLYCKTCCNHIHFQTTQVLSWILQAFLAVSITDAERPHCHWFLKRVQSLWILSGGAFGVLMSLWQKDPCFQGPGCAWKICLQKSNHPVACYGMLGMCKTCDRSSWYMSPTTSWSLARSIHCQLPMVQSDYNNNFTLNTSDPSVL